MGFVSATVGAIPCGCPDNHKGLPGQAQGLPLQCHTIWVISCTRLRYFLAYI
jgi:hypothetical protein